MSIRYVTYYMMTNTAVLYTEKWERVNPKSSHYKEETVFLFFPVLFLLYLYEKMDVSWIYCVNCLTVYMNQITMLYNLNLYSDVYQLLFNKTGRKC